MEVLHSPVAPVPICQVLREGIRNPRIGGGGNPMAMALFDLAFYLFALGGWGKNSKAKNGDESVKGSGDTQ
jgi:hypothetical protein